METAQRDIKRGLAGILTAAFLFTIMAVGTRFAAAAGVPSGETTFIRFASGFLVLVTLTLLRVIKIEPKNKPWLILRGIFGGIAILCYFFALSTGVLTNAVVLNASYPIFVAAFSYVFIKEKVRKLVYLILPIAFIGILLVIKPSARMTSVADLFALASAVFAALGILTIRRLRETDAVWTILLSLNGFGMLLSVGFFLSNPVMPSTNGWIAVFTVAAASNLAQVLLTYSYKFIRASEGSIIIKVSVVFTAVIAYFLFGERLDAAAIAGAVIILACSAILSLTTPHS